MLLANERIVVCVAQRPGRLIGRILPGLQATNCQQQHLGPHQQIDAGEREIGHYDPPGE
jgi:hypothetical protein